MRKFIMIDEEFECENCHQHVPKLLYTARYHCPYCLYSKHVDNNPGDRACECYGMLKPKGIKKYRNTFKIIYECIKCGKEKTNIMAGDDNMDIIINLSSRPIS